VSVTPPSSWPWLDHPVSGLRPPTESPCSDSLSLRLPYSVKLAGERKSLTHYTKGTPSPQLDWPFGPIKLAARLATAIRSARLFAFDPRSLHVVPRLSSLHVVPRLSSLHVVPRLSSLHAELCPSRIYFFLGGLLLRAHFVRGNKELLKAN
jgi:hypothetical protein